MSQDDKDLALSALIVRYLEGDTTPEQDTELGQQLKSNASARALLVRVSSVQTLLAEKFAAESKWEQMLAAEKLGTTRSASDRRHSRRLKFTIPFAAAAALVLAAGIFWMQHTQRSVPFTVTQQIGHVIIDGNTIATDRDSFCKIALQDGSVLALDEKTEVDIGQNPETAGKTVRQKEGRLYLDAVPQETPIIVGSAEMDVELLGTRILMDQSDGPRVDVLEGTIRVTSGALGTDASVGQTVGLTVYDEHHRFLKKSALAAEPPLMTWLTALGIDMKSTWPASASRPALVKSSRDDWSTYRIHRGRWTITYDEDRPIIRIESKDVSIIEFGEKSVKEGVFTFAFRVLDIHAEKPRAGASFFNETGRFSTFNLQSRLSGVWTGQYRGWVYVRYKFRLDQDNRVVVTRCDFWPETRPGRKQFLEEWRYPSEVVMANGCRVGLSISGFTAEVKDLAFNDQGTED